MKKAWNKRTARWKSGSDKVERLQERERQGGEEHVRNMLNMPFCAYWVQISTTFLESCTLALVAPSSLMFCLMNSTAR
jgi:hypothetical protein